MFIAFSLGLVLTIFVLLLSLLNRLSGRIVAVYGDAKLDENDIEAFDLLRGRISDAYSEGKLNEKHYESLRGKISTLYEEIFRKKIAALDGKNNYYYLVIKKPMQEQLAQIRYEIK